MKNQKILILTGALLLAGLVACKPNNSSSEVPPSSSEPTSQAPSSEVEEKEMTVEEAEEIIAKFDTTLTGTVKATYHADYVLDVQSESASAKAFAEDKDRTINIEADFTEGSLYLYVGYTAGEEKVEALVYQDSDKYYYLESTLADPIALTNESAALAKIEELVLKVSKTKAGWVDMGTFLYTGTMSYEHSQFLLDSTNVELEFLDDTRSFEENEKGGLDITSTLEYVGYTTDGGTSELSPDDSSEGKVGANIVVSTDAKGRVVSFTSTYDEAKLEMPIMTPAPLLTLTGSHSFEAEYGATLTKKTTIDHEATFGTVVLPAVTTKGYAEVFYCKPEKADLANMKEVKATTEIPVGHWILVKVTAAEGNNVEAVTYANNSQTLIPPAQAGGYYCFEALPGENAVGVNISGSAALPTSATATATAPEGVTVKGPVGFTLAGQAPSAWDYVAADGFEFGADKWIAIGLENVPEGKEAVVTVDGKEAFFLAGYYCVNAKFPKEYKYTVSLKDKEVVSGAAVTVSKDANVSKVELSHFLVTAPTEQTPITDGVAPVGKWLAVKVTAAEGYEIDTVKVAGDDLMFISGYYCYNVKTADAIEVVIATKAASTPEVTVAAVTVNKDANVTSAPLTWFTMENPTVQTPVENDEVEIGKWVAVKPVLAEGYVIDSVKVGDADTTFYYGYYCYQVKDATAIEFVVTTKTA